MSIPNLNQAIKKHASPEVLSEMERLYSDINYRYFDHFELMDQAKRNLHISDKPANMSGTRVNAPILQLSK